MTETKKASQTSLASKQSRAAFQTALIYLDIDRNQVLEETGIKPSPLNRMLEGTNPEAWKVLGPYFKSKGYDVPNLEALTMPHTVSLVNCSLAKRQLINLLLPTDIGDETVLNLTEQIKKQEAAGESEQSGEHFHNDIPD